MSDVLAPIEIARREEARQARGTASCVREAEEIAGGWMTFDAVGSWSNQAVGLGLDGPVSEDDVERLVAFYTSRGVEPRLEVTPFTHRSLLDALAARGFVLRGFENVLARPIQPNEDLWRALPRPLDPALRLERVAPDDEAAVEEWIRVSWCGFLPEGESPSASDAAISRRIAQGRHCAAFAAYLDDRMVGAAGMEAGIESSGLFGTSVRAAYRRRGVQQALIVARLEHAQRAGGELACIVSEPGIPTERNALRLGFQVAYAKAVLVQTGEGLVPSP